MLTRRTFIERLAAAGGASMAYDAMTGLGLMATPQASNFDLQGQVNGVRVIVLGGGIAGLTTAYELGKLGYNCRVLEARGRPGGRAHTIRRGTVSEEEGSTQTCEFDEGLYFNPGAMRIAYHHTTTLGYCRELGVPVETFAVTAENQFLYQTKSAALTGRRIRQREVRADMDGYVAELLSKAISDQALDQAIGKDDRERLLDYLRSVNRLDPKGKYVGNPTRGPDPARPTDRNSRSTPLSISELLGSRTGYYLDLGYEYQPTMMQVVGGTDRLPQALAVRLKDKVTYHAAARQIRQTDNGVSVVYADQAGKLHKIDAEYCVAALPLPLLAEVDTDFPEEFKKTIASVPYQAAGKMGLQFKRRFWEEDESIFGGASKTDQEISQIIYPSSGYLTKKGVLVGYYLQGQNGRAIGDKSPGDRLALALEQGARVHPQYPAEFEHGFSVAWHKTTWNRGSWSSMSADARRILSEPDRRVYLAGDHLNLNAWMQGAFESARQVATAIHARANVQRPSAAV